MLHRGMLLRAYLAKEKPFITFRVAKKVTKCKQNLNKQQIIAVTVRNIVILFPNI